jgi:hypothetical protein
MNISEKSQNLAMFHFGRHPTIRVATVLDDPGHIFDFLSFQSAKAPLDA